MRLASALLVALFSSTIVANPFPSPKYPYSRVARSPQAIGYIGPDGTSPDTPSTDDDISNGTDTSYNPSDERNLTFYITDAGDQETYNFTLLRSGCKNGLLDDTSIGPYRLNNGTTLDNANFLDIKQDISAIRSANSFVTAQSKFKSHFSYNLQAAINEANALIDAGQLICNDTSVSSPPPEHDELRKLLAKYEGHWAATVGLAVTGTVAAGGYAAGITAAGLNDITTAAIITGGAAFITIMLGGLAGHLQRTGRLTQPEAVTAETSVSYFRQVIKFFAAIVAQAASSLQCFNRQEVVDQALEFAERGVSDLASAMASDASMRDVTQVQQIIDQMNLEVCE